MSKTLQELAQQALELSDTSELTRALSVPSLQISEVGSSANLAAQLADSARCNSLSSIRDDFLKTLIDTTSFEHLLSGTASSVAESLAKLESDSFASAAAKVSALCEHQAHDFARIAEQAPVWVSLAKTVEEHKALVRPAFGPIEDLLERANSAFSLATPQVEALVRIPQLIEERFRLPDLGESALLASKLAESLRSIEAPAYLKDIESAMESMKSPWLEVHKELQSAQAFAAVQDIGAQLRDSVTAFDEDFAAALRNRLGDWRDSITLPANIEEVIARSAFYVERGLDATLTNFPPVAFRANLQIAGLTEIPAVGIAVYDYHVPAESDDEEDGFRRTNAAHDRLLRFETHLRRFIDTRMSAAFGVEWPKQRVPSDTYAKWLEKRQKAADSGEAPRPLVAYADFTDYERILLRKDNWDAVFKAVFRRQESVRESLQRLYPVRLCTMHARLITQDDELLLFVEVKRLLKAIGSI